MNHHLASSFLTALCASVVMLFGAVAEMHAQISPAEYATRRAALAEAAPPGIILALGSGEPSNNYSVFWQNPHFDWLTGLRESGAALVIDTRTKPAREVLFVEGKDPAQEVWTGKRLGPDGASAQVGVPARPIGQLDALLDSLLAGGTPLHVIREQSEGGDFTWADERRLDAIRQRHPSLDVVLINPLVLRLRGTKSAAELALIRQAIDITVQAHREAAKALAPGMNEFELQALIEYTFRRNGADRPSFATIVGSGPNSTTLHYNADDRFVNAGEVVVMDIGASYRGYAADVTRTYPVNGRFTDDQRSIYQLVRDAQEAAARQAKPGNRARVMSDSANAVLEAGLARLGLIDSVGATYECGADGRRKCRQLGLYYMHGLGHGIGLEVHDPDQYYFTGILAEGSAFTIEPGIYVRANLLEILPDTPANRAWAERRGAAVRRYANIGVRIEDDYIITATGAEWVSRAPREVAEVEALMAEPWTGPAARDVKRVEAYRPFAPRP
jgi:Xaa-Pro aminopeptidase